MLDGQCFELGLASLSKRTLHVTTYAIYRACVWTVVSRAFDLNCIPSFNLAARLPERLV